MLQQKILEIKNWLLDPKNKMLSIAMLAMLAIILVTSLTPNPTKQDANVIESADTFIPAGYALVPIEIQNIESLSSLIGPYAIVDLFSGLPGGKQQKVGKKLKLLRAPLNPDQFAVLVAEDEVGYLLQQPGPYWAVIQNPNLSSKESIEKRSVRKSKVEYYAGE